MRYLLGLLLLLGFPLTLSAIDIVAGEVTYRQISGYTYEATLILYVDKRTTSDQLRSTAPGFSWGDGTTETLIRTRSENLSDGIHQKFSYVATHTYPGPSTYLVSFIEEWRIAGIKNINFPNESKGDEEFYIESALIINPFNPVGKILKNNSPILTNPPLDQGCVFQVFEHNPGAYDPDGDVLTYQLINCRGGSGRDIKYVSPDLVSPGANNKITIDPVSGTVHWDAAQKVGLYNIAILINEFRNGKLVGSVVRDMQINILNCANRPPVLDPVSPACVMANTSYKFTVQARDQANPNDVIHIDAFGEPFEHAATPADIVKTLDGNPALIEINWLTSCSDVRNSVYNFVYKATDDGKEPMSDYGTSEVKVVAPAVTLSPPAAVPSGVQLNWTPSVCTNSIGYTIYRGSCSASGGQGPCDNGPLPGFVKIATVEGYATTAYIDTAIGFSHEYCYIVTSNFPNGAQSQSSSIQCVFPVFQELVKVSVGRTDASKGIDTIKWSYPDRVDTAVRYQGPYQYRIYRRMGEINADSLIAVLPFCNDLALCDTTYIDSLINTQDTLYTYRIELYSNGTFVGSSSNATSIFLKGDPQDRRVDLKWDFQVPWVHSVRELQQYDSATATWNTIKTVFLDAFTNNIFRDTVFNLINGKSYCFRMIWRGAFCDTLMNYPLVNYSNEFCIKPVDKSGPCPPPFSLTDFCKQGYIEVNWQNLYSNPQNCNADILQYQLYYAARPGQPLTKVRDFSPSQNQFIYTAENGSIAGCFAMAAIDSIGNQGAIGPVLCVDNCPSYELPNVFTPNGDGENDVFRPFPYYAVESIDLKVYNRWGKLVFETTKPDILWDGKIDGKPATDGVYFYVCDVNKITLRGVVKETLKGNVTIFSGGGSGGQKN